MMMDDYVNNGVTKTVLKQKPSLCHSTANVYDFFYLDTSVKLGCTVKLDCIGLHVSLVYLMISA